MAIDYSERIPNNVNLAGDRTLQRALEHWQPQFLDWWREMGPNDFAAADVYLRTAVGVDAQGWAQLRRGQDARLPLGHLPRRRGPRPHASASATSTASRCGSRCRASSARSSAA